MKILLDVFGCDRPCDVILGIADALRAIPDVIIVAAGDRSYIEQILKDEEFDRARLEFIDAKEVITNDDAPVMAIRRKRESSLVMAYEALRDREDLPIMISAGNTGAILVGAILILGRENRLDRPTLVTFMPNNKGGVTCLADCGANVDCRPEYLVKYAKYASEHMARVYGIEKPRVALLSVGVEDEKGNMQTKETFALLKEEKELNFVGNMESREALSGDYDVIVADGFSGNILLKSIEGTAKAVISRMIESIKRHAPEGADLSFIKEAVRDMNESLDFNSMGGAVILGTKKPIIKAHGSANRATVVNTVKQAIKIINN